MVAIASELSDKAFTLIQENCKYYISLSEYVFTELKKKFKSLKHYGSEPISFLKRLVALSQAKGEWVIMGLTVSGAYNVLKERNQVPSKT